MSTDVPTTVTPVSRRLDDDNPWPGLDAFDEASQRYFKGRDAEVAELLRRVEQSPLTVLFSQSGLGKTSLLRAGLLPRLRERNFLPVYVRLGYQAGAPAPERQMRDALRATMKAEGIDAPAMVEDESLWAYLHRAGLELWNARNFPVTPVFVIDQFEEVFTLGAAQPERTVRWRMDLGDLAENRIPANLRDATDQSLALREMKYRLLISLREDFLAELEGWRASIPSLGRVRMRLLPMTPAQALAAVHQSAPHLMDEALAQRIVAFVAAAQAEQLARANEAPDAGGLAPDKGTGVVEPALLSLFCRGLNDQRRAQGKTRFDEALLEGAKQGILTDYYRSCFDGMPDSVSRFVASELITERGYRNSVSKDDATPAHMSEAQLATLIDRRLVRLEERYGTQRIELTHDLLTRVVREHRDRLREEEARLAARQRAEDERQALEQHLRAQRQAEREQQLQAEARAGRRFKRLAMALGVALVVAVIASVAALYQVERVRRAELEARQQRDAATAERKVADEQRALAERERQLAEQRLKRITDSIGMKQAVLSGDQARIRRYLEQDSVRSRIRFTARAESLGYRNPQGRPVYRFSLLPTPDTLARARTEAAVITYRMDHETFHNSLLATGPERDFAASYIGWGCLSNVVVLVEYIDPDRPAEIAAFNMCEAL